MGLGSLRHPRSPHGAAPGLKILRMVRLARILRIVRVVRFFSELRVPQLRAVLLGFGAGVMVSW